jgi:hypothetical protein
MRSALRIGLIDVVDDQLREDLIDRRVLSPGDEWAVRLIIELDERDQDPARKLIYKHVAGLGRRTTAVTTRGEFARWACHEVYRDEENWRRVAGSGETVS